MSQPRSWIAAIIVAAALLPSTAHADKNEIRAVTFDDDNGTTNVHVRGAQTPTFTVYKLERPTRVVIDVPQARLAESLRGHESNAVLTPSTWAVSTIAAQQLDDGGQVVRVIVTLARPGRYDVKTVGNELIVMVTARDPAPKTASPEELERAKQAAAEQSARADAALKAAEEARRAGKSSAEEIAKLRGVAQQAEQAKRDAAIEADRARAQAAAAQAEATKTKQDAARELEAAAKVKADAEAAMLQANRDAVTIKKDADAAIRSAEAQKIAAERAAQQAARDAETTKQVAKQDIAKTRAEVDAAKAEATRAKTAADAAQADAKRELEAATKARAEAEAARAEAAQKQAEALAAKSQADAAQREAAQRRAEASAAKSQIDAAQRAASASRSQAEAAIAESSKSRTELDAAKRQAEASRTEADTAKRQADAAKADAARAQAAADAARAEAGAAKAQAETARHEAEVAKTQAAGDKKQAEAARTAAETMLRDARARIAELDQRTAAAQALEDKARSVNAAAQAREEAAKLAVAKAAEERAAAETAAKHAIEARDKSAASEKARLAEEARAAETKLAAARQATDTAEQQRAAAERAAQAAKQDLEQSRVALASVEHQRTAAETAASDAARKRSEAEAAATDATRRRGEAETAAAAAAKQRAAAEQAVALAAKQRTDAERERDAAEHQKKAAEDAARIAKVAADAADQQRVVAEQAAHKAESAKHDAEVGLAELSSRRQDAEKAAAALETRSKAEAKAQAELAAAQVRKASDDEQAKIRTELARLGDDRKRAETELADRRKAVATQQAESDRLKLAASQAHDAADREEARRAQLTAQRVAEEAELARIKAQKSAATLATMKPGPNSVVAPTGVAPNTIVASGGVAAAGTGGTTAPTTGAAVARVAASSGTTSTATTKPGTTLVGTTGSGSTSSAATKPGTTLAGTTTTAKAPPTTAAAAPTIPTKKTPLAKVTNIVFAGDDSGGQVTIALAGDATITTGEVSATAAELIIDHAELAGKLERKLDVKRFGSPVHYVSSFRDRRVPDRVRLIAELATPATPTFDRLAGTLTWHFAGAKHTLVAAHTQNVPSPVVGGFGAASTPIAQQSVSQLPPQGRRQRVYHGAPVELHYKDAPIHDLLRSLADVGKVNIVVPDTIDFKVTVDMKRVPWDEALEVILSSHDLWYRKQGNLYRIAPRKDLDKEDEDEAKRRQAAVEQESPRTDIIPLNYASAADLQKKLDNLKSPKGHIEVDERTNKLIITDVAGNREQMKSLALSLDTQTPQISIEARIVEARSNFLRQLGIQWGGNANASAAGGNATGLVFPSSIGIVGGAEDNATNRNGVAIPSNFAVNLPAAVGTGEGGALGISLGSVGGNFNINLRISALEDAGTIRIISAPKVTVLNGKEAKIAQGVSIPISVVSAAGTSTQFVQADLALTVTPTVSQRDCAITMSLQVTKNEPDFVNVGARGDPSILRKEAKTSMLINDGQTGVLGGIYTRNSGLAYKKVPLLGDLPVLGWLFKNRRENDDRTEILVFITPKITNRELLPCSQ